MNTKIQLMNKESISLFLLTGLLFAASCEKHAVPRKSASDTLVYYENPVFEPTFADPTIIATGEGFYAYATEDFWENKEHLVAIIHSSDLVDWNYIGDAFTEKPNWKQGGIWAPNVFTYDGRYFMFYSLSTWGDSNPGIGLAISDDPEGPFTDKGKFLLSSEAGVVNSIDPFFYNDTQTGELYLFWGSFHGIYGSLMEYSNGTFALAGEIFQITGNLFEGSYIYYKNGYYYYFGSMGSCCDGANSSYQVRVGRSQDIRGPYVDPSGNSLMNNVGEPGKLLIKGNITPDGFAGPGHNGEIITDSAGNNWFIYHAISKEQPLLNNGATRRPLMIDRLKWFEGWPMIDYSEPSMIKRQVPEF
jgi:arabinan endo-1,5-alpha-L-arabinosidase